MRRPGRSGLRTHSVHSELLLCLSTGQSINAALVSMGLKASTSTVQRNLQGLQGLHACSGASWKNRARPRQLSSILRPLLPRLHYRSSYVPSRAPRLCLRQRSCFVTKKRTSLACPLPKLVGVTWRTDRAPDVPPLSSNSHFTNTHDPRHGSAALCIRPASSAGRNHATFTLMIEGRLRLPTS
jgi:hypothetical protein